MSRYREELAAGHDYPEALARAIEGAGRVVCFSGLALGTGLGGLMFFRGSFLWAMGVGGAVVVALAIVFALTFLPALLAVLGPRIHAWALPISPPSALTALFKAIFCGLNGATRAPARRAKRHRPATKVLLPASEVVPCTIKVPLGKRPDPAEG